mmetsp:Transcript_9646/g.16693  ORF Transcript_9646/g.16693 Transcript_9646/m.16693 type:complete len:226 (-) Transcript_9646:123-800(-)
MWRRTRAEACGGGASGAQSQPRGRYVNASFAWMRALTRQRVGMCVAAYELRWECSAVWGSVAVVWLLVEDTALPARPVGGARSPAPVQEVRVAREDRLAELLVDGVVHLTQPRGKLFAVGEARGIGRDIGLEASSAIPTRVQSREQVHELAHVVLLLRRWRLRVVRRHGVQKRPPASAKLFSVGGTWHGGRRRRFASIIVLSRPGGVLCLLFFRFFFRVKLKYCP